VPTIGVSIALPEPWASQLQDYRTSIGDETAAMIPTHITLVPPTDVADSDVEAVHAHLATVAESQARFPIELRGTGTFRPVSPVVFVTLARGIGGCERLADAIRRGPLDLELVYPYHPHVTIAHHLDDAALDQAYEDLAGFSCDFDVRNFHLYEHDETVGWSPTSAFHLADPTPR
jgi:2'-5' RNA ligase